MRTPARPFQLIGAAAFGAVAMLVSVPAAWATSFAVVYTFPNTNPLAPQIGAVRNGVIYGVDPAGGTNGVGVLFTISSGGSYAPLYTFSYAGGVTPNSRLILDGSGGVIGTTQGSGGAGSGTIFRVSAQGQLLWSHTLQPVTEGEHPLDGLAAGPLGSFYGTTSGGAISPGNGTLFRITASGQFHVLHYFLSTAIDGHCPYTGVAVDASGTIYGTSVGMGFGGQPNGALWARRGAGSPTVFYSFTDGSDGEWPQVTPSLDHSGNLWGVTYDQGGTTAAGAIWKDTSGGFAVVHSFTGGTDGYFPNSQLLLASDGNFYGTTQYGGKASGMVGQGVVFRIAPTSPAGTAPTIVHTFGGGSDGANPVGNLVMDASGHIYGGTSAGTIYMITP